MRPCGRVAAPLRPLAGLIAAVSAAVLWSAPWSPAAGRTPATRRAPHRAGPETISQVHADLVFLLIGLSVALWFALRAVGAARPPPARRPVLVAVELAQGLIGFVQYFTHLPAILVGAAHARRLPGLAGHPALWRRGARA